MRKNINRAGKKEIIMAEREDFAFNEMQNPIHAENKAYIGTIKK